MKKNKGFTLLESVVILFFIISTSTFLIFSYKENLNNNMAYNNKINIINLVNYAVKKSLYDKKNYEINFNLNEHNIVFLDNKINLNKNFIFETKNISNNFIRKTTKKGNLDKGFTIYIKAKNKKKIYETIIFNNSNGLLKPILNEKN